MFRNLVARNRDVPQEQLQRQLAANGGVGRNPVQLPFILIQVSNKTNAMQLNLGIDAEVPPVPPFCQALCSYTVLVMSTPRAVRLEAGNLPPVWLCRLISAHA